MSITSVSTAEWDIIHLRALEQWALMSPEMKKAMTITAAWATGRFGVRVEPIDLIDQQELARVVHAKLEQRAGYRHPHNDA